MEEQKKELASTSRGMENAKVRQLDMYTASTDGPMTNDEGIKLTTTTETLKVGPRGPTLIQDFNFREKITRFDHERIPERVVHARGAAAHGYFQVYKSLSDVTRARFLTDTSLKTPVFVRFSTVLGSRGSPDTVRDVRGFATRFYTPEGNFDLVGNNIPVFFIQDAMQFPDLIHAGKPEPQNEIPQAQTAHDNFWDFISLTPEAMHMIMWTLSDRAIPKSFATMEGFGVNTFRLINEKGDAHFVKWHWLPVLGTASLVWDEALKISGKDPDYHRRQMFESIEKGIPFEYELGLQIFDEAQAAKFDFDILDCTKIVPEELVPIHKVGRMVLNRNVDNYFAETEQVAFCVHNLVPGIDVSDDPLLHGRMHSYFDTQLTRLGGPNFTEIPINQPICPVYNFNQDGFGRQRIIKGNVNYWPNSRGGGCPFMSSIKQGGYMPFPAQISGPKIAVRSDSFKDHYTQARMFYHSLTEIEQMHLLDAASFEWGKVADLNIRQRMLDHLSKITLHGARYVAEKLSLPTPTEGFTGDVRYTNISIERRKQPSVKGRKIAVLVSDGFNLSQVNAVKAVLEEGGATVNLVGIRASHLDDAKEKQACDFTFETAGSVLFDGFFIPGGAHAVKLCQTGNAIFWINEAYKHCKPIAAVEEGVDLIRRSAIRGVRLAEGDSSDLVEDKGVVTLRNALDARGVISTLKRAALPPSFVETFVTAIGAHRHWSRVLSDPVNFDSIPV